MGARLRVPAEPRQKREVEVETRRQPVHRKPTALRQHLEAEDARSTSHKRLGKKRRQLRAPSSDQTASRGCQNVKLIGWCQRVRPWLSFLGLRTVARA
jgi:hypothetical protein